MFHRPKRVVSTHMACMANNTDSQERLYGTIHVFVVLYGIIVGYGDPSNPMNSLSTEEILLK